GVPALGDVELAAHEMGAGAIGRGNAAQIEQVAWCEARDGIAADQHARRQRSIDPQRVLAGPEGDRSATGDAPRADLERRAALDRRTPSIGVVGGKLHLAGAIDNNTAMTRPG